MSLTRAYTPEVLGKTLQKICNKVKISEMVQNSESCNILKVLICPPWVLLQIQDGVQYGRHRVCRQKDFKPIFMNIDDK